MKSIRLRLSQWFAPKGYIVRPWRLQDTQDLLDEAAHEMTMKLGETLYGPEPTPQELWREVRAKRMAERGQHGGQ